jgi:hypothetical protein
MIRSSDRILTTHIGSLYRSDELMRLYGEEFASKPPVAERCFVRSGLCDVADPRLELPITSLGSGCGPL